MTEWRPVVGYEGLYEVSSLGNVRSVLRGAECRQHLNGGGYWAVSLRGKNRLVHRLVATAFIPNPAGKPQVNHIDSNRQNARLENLEWATASENVKHGYNAGNVKPPYRVGMASNAAKMGDDLVATVRSEYRAGSVTYQRLADKYGFCKRTIQDAVKGVYWKHVQTPTPPQDKP